jgi:hypothetical protein
MVLLFVGLSLSACAPTLRQIPVDAGLAASEAEKQRELALDLMMKRDDRLTDVAFPLRRAAADLCSEHQKVMGIRFHDKSTYLPEYRQAAANLYNVGNAVQVRSVCPGFPAAEAGIAPKDSILAVDGAPVKNTKDAMKKLKKAAERGSAVTLTVANSDGRHDVLVPFVTVAAYPVELAANDEINAFADGEKVYIATGMLRFAETEEELAVVVGHELAHNCLGHTGKKTGNWLLGSLVDAAVLAGTGVDTGNLFGAVAGNSFSKEFEAEADYMGLYLVQRAGYDITSAPQFWRRMAAEYPSSIKHSYTASHPSTPERFLALQNTVAEIDRKTSAGEPLIPERR